MSSTPLQSQQITFTRFIAAITIVFFHFGGDLEYINNPIFLPIKQYGNLGVSYFFLISGVIMSLVYSNKVKLSKAFFRDFYIIRLSRVYPIYLFSLIVVIFFTKYFWRSQLDLSEILFSVFLIQSWVPGKELTLNFPGWSLSVEIFFYLFFPFLILFFRKIGNRKTYMVSFIIWFITQGVFICYFTEGSHLLYNPIMHSGTFIIGAAFGIFLKSNADRLTFIPPNIWAVLLIISTLSFVAIIYNAPAWLALSHNGLLSPLFLIITMSLCLDRKSIGRAFKIPLAVFLGNISYGIYIYQYPVKIFTSYINDKFGLRNWNAYHFYYFLVMLLIVASLSFIVLESPIRDRVKKLINYT
ncbi:acyltransferase family protein [Imperialibacter roseus]|uniref:acyltransferase family protein n=1 Tax=Imperialibacter roseus TaxID=1324217 RepID=UPI00374FC0BE